MIIWLTIYLFQLIFSATIDGLALQILLGIAFIELLIEVALIAIGIMAALFNLAGANDED